MASLFFVIIIKGEQGSEGEKGDPGKEGPTVCFAICFLSFSSLFSNSVLLTLS